MSVVSDTLRTEDPGEAERFVRRVYPVAQIRESRRPFSYSHEVRGDERAAFARFAISSWTEIEVDFESVLGVGQVLGGAYRATSNGDDIDPTGPFLLRPGIGRSQSEGLDLLMLNLDERALGRFAGAWRGVDDVHLRFPGVAPVMPGGYWPDAVAHLRGVFHSPELLANDLLRASAVDLLFAAALTTFPVEVLGRERPDASDGSTPAAVRRAVAFIDDNVGRGITVEDIAAAARLSIRGLQVAFQRNLGTTPTGALRAARLSAVHADLLAGDPTTDTVAAVARRWGLQHLGRFAAEYRAQYGELPNETLRRGE